MSKVTEMLKKLKTQTARQRVTTEYSEKVKQAYSKIAKTEEGRILLHYLVSFCELEVLNPIKTYMPDLSVTEAIIFQKGKQSVWLSAIKPFLDSEDELKLRLEGIRDFKKREQQIKEESEKCRTKI